MCVSVRRVSNLFAQGFQKVAHRWLAALSVCQGVSCHSLVSDLSSSLGYLCYNERKAL